MNEATVAMRPSGMVPGKTSRSGLRRRNRRFLLRLIQTEGPISHAEVALHLNSDPAYHGTLTATSSIPELAAAAEQGDTLAHRGIEESAANLVRGLVNLICNFDQELVILSGHVVWDCPALMDAGLRRVIAVRSSSSTQSAEGGVIAASAIVRSGTSTKPASA